MLDATLLRIPRKMLLLIICDMNLFQTIKALAGIKSSCDKERSLIISILKAQQDVWNMAYLFLNYDELDTIMSI